MPQGNKPNKWDKRGLIKRDEKGNIVVEGVDLFSLPSEVCDIILKLSDYEASGLTPNDVSTLKSIYDDACETICKMRLQCKEMKSKLIELPVRPGDVVYDCRDFFCPDIEYPRIRRDRVFSVKILEDDLKRTGGKRGVYLYRTEFATYRREDFGKTVFLDEKKAEICAERVMHEMALKER